MTTWFSLVMNLAPLVLMAVPGMPPVLIPTLVHAIQEAQQIPGASGAAKKAHVLAVATDAVTAVNGAKGTQVIDPGVVPGVVSHGIDTTIGVINLVQRAHATPAPTPASTPAM